ncbi:MAG: hypothetical protein K2H52_10415 [Lachnospiraceae bacterium]|nr:hypothetical protein [Lachnospiraceae bacterium]MDE6183844.1 hypothetical protein [Lachnospiraceae bacterium]
MKSKGQAAFYAIAGGYLLYLAYQLFGGRMDNAGEDYVMALLFSIFFAVAGTAILVYTAIMYQKILKKEAQELAEPEESAELKLEEEVQKETPKKEEDHLAEEEQF